MTHFTKKELKERNPKDQQYAERVASELKALNVPKRPVTTVQSASTQRILSMTREEHAEHNNRPLPTRDQWQAKPTKPLKENATQDEYYAWLTGQRDLPLDQVFVAEDIRRKPKNSIGQSLKSSASDERKELARQAYVCTPPTEILDSQKEHVTEMNPITELKEIPRETKQSLFDKFMDWFEHFGETPENMSYMEKQEFFKERGDDDKQS